MNIKNIIFIIIAAGIYFLLLPNFWAAPKVKVEIPTAAFSEYDKEFTVALRSWHSNVDINTVILKVEVDPRLNASTGVFETVLFKKEKRIWDAKTKGISRFSWPNNHKKTLEIPIRKMILNKLVARGYMRGNVLIKATYAKMTRGKVTTEEIISEVPFKCKLL